MTNQEIKELLKRFEDNTCTPEDDALLQNWFLHTTNVEELPAPVPDYAKVKATVFHNITGRPKIIRFRSSIKYAAAVIAIVGIGSILYFGTIRKSHSEKEPEVIAEILPGGNKAILTLANGQQIALDDAANGTLAQQGNVQITKNASGQLVYVISSKNEGSFDSATTRDPSVVGMTVMQYNTITTPNGGQYEVFLPDGSHVYLNAASSLKYPTRFTESERKVTLTGEGYFEITKKTKQPFIVTTTDQYIKVLGTHFNVSCYPNELAKTTLAEGSVFVSLNKTKNNSLNLPSATLKPGQQAINTGNSLLLIAVNPADQIAWKDGLFVFNQSTIKSVLQQICRWYDVTVDYSTLPEKHFEGEISRDLPLSEVLKVIGLTNHVNFKIEGRRITLQK